MLGLLLCVMMFFELLIKILVLIDLGGNFFERILSCLKWCFGLFCVLCLCGLECVLVMWWIVVWVGGCIGVVLL